MKKFLSVLSIILIITQLLPICAAAAVSTAPFDVVPQIILPQNLFYLDGTNVEDAFASSNPVSFPYSDEQNLLFSPLSSVNLEDTELYGVLIPLDSFQVDASKTEDTHYVIDLNFSSTIQGFYGTNDDYPNQVYDDTKITLPVSKFYTNYNFSDQSEYSFSPLIDNNTYYKENGRIFSIYYSYSYNPLDPTVGNSNYYPGTLTWHIRLIMSYGVQYNTPLNIFIPIDFSKWFLPGEFTYNLNCHEPVVTELVDNDIDDIHSLLTDIYTLVGQLNSSLGGLSSLPTNPGGATNLGEAIASIISELYTQNMVNNNSFQQLQEKTQEIIDQVDDLNENMTSYVEQADQNTKDSFVKEATEELDENVTEMLEKVDIINTDAVESTNINLYNALTTDSMRPVLSVPDFIITLFDKEYVLWTNFTIDIAALVDQMGIDEYITWFRFIFYFGFGWFLYGKVNRIIRIVLLDPVSESTPK